MAEKVRYAILGLGHIAQVAVLPGFQHAPNSELVAFVSGDVDKLAVLGRQYGVKDLLNYGQYEDLLASGSIDAVYIATPNTLHTEYVEKALQNGVHVLCEKPFATTEEECERMIEASFQNNTKLMVAYRLHFDEANLKAISLAQSGRLGQLRIFHSVHSYELKDDENIRLKASFGGGSLFDIGIYCINAARYIFEDEPTEVFAFRSTDPSDQRFVEVPEMWSAVMRFPADRVASFTCSFAAADTSHYEVVGTKGSLRLYNAYEYAYPMQMILTVGEKKKKMTFPKKDQFGAEIAYFSDCILNDEQPEPSGLEGLADVRIMQALIRSAKRGVCVSVDPVRKSHWPTEKQEIRKPGVKKPKTVHVTSPSD